MREKRHRSTGPPVDRGAQCVRRSKRHIAPGLSRLDFAAASGRRRFSFNPGGPPYCASALIGRAVETETETYATPAHAGQRRPPRVLSRVGRSPKGTQHRPMTSLAPSEVPGFRSTAGIAVLFRGGGGIPTLGRRCRRQRFSSPPRLARKASRRAKFGGRGNVSGKETWSLPAQPLGGAADPRWPVLNRHIKRTTREPSPDTSREPNGHPESRCRFGAGEVGVGEYPFRVTGTCSRVP